MYHPTDPAYTDQSAVRAELTRSFDICQTCRRCTDLCSSFPTLFSLLDGIADRDAGRLTPAEQDRVIDACHQCTLCAVGCPHGSPIESPGIDIPRLMNRARAMHHANGLVPVGVRLAARAAAEAGVVGRLARPVVVRVSNARRGSTVRKIANKMTGVAPDHGLPSRAAVRFSTWFRKRVAAPVDSPQGSVAVFPSCLVEHSEPAIGHDVVKVYEHNRITCTVPDVGCCGAPLLHAGDVHRFTARAEKVVRALADVARSGSDIVVPQPTCSKVLKHEFPNHLRSSRSAADADLVAKHVYDVTDYLLQLHRSPGYTFDVDVVGDVPARVAVHAPCHLRAQGLEVSDRDLLELLGSRVESIEHCSGAAGLWGTRQQHTDESSELARRVAAQLTERSGDVVVGPCHLANTHLAARTGDHVQHPVQVVARAYGIEPER